MVSTAGQCFLGWVMKKWIWVLAIGIAACSSSNDKPDNVYRQSDESRPLVDDKYSLQADRQALADLRQNIPEDKKRENDELALILGMMSEVKKSPSDIRSRFDSVLRKKRELFNKDMTKEREAFTKDERKKRDDFMKSQREAREMFNREKHTRDEKNEFFRDLDQKRSETSSVERDRRADFEADVRERRKNFEDYIREKQNEFNQENRAYTKRYEEMKKQERDREREKQKQVIPHNPFNDEAQQLEQELMEIRSRPGSSLQSGE